ncbi:helix-turn-helix domain-containing protein [Caulobacter sp. ErkDOM-YI]|jgi:hypothetical protein|uniref:helix-turn-helix domain-containing protein n=1 Tax=unclassified Caulobacter TaxID=2648921 RepID=UPI003AF86AE6
MGTPALQPRLLTAEEAAAYLNIPKATLVRHAWGIVKVGMFRRYDRYALDAHLDGIGGLNTPAQRAVNGVGGPEDPEAALDRFLAP